MTQDNKPRGAKPYDRNKGRGRPPAHRAKPGTPPEGPLYLYGLHTVEAALANPERKRIKMYVTLNAQRRLEERNLTIDVPVEVMEPRAIARMVPDDAVHQGVILEVEALPVYGLEHLRDAKLVLALDQLTDPHNVGAILRSAVALGVDAVVSTLRHSPEESAVLAKSASGALDMIRFMRVQNMARFIEEAGEAGFQRIALDSEGPATLEDTEFGDKVILVLGSEGKGVRQGVRGGCDTLARLDMPGKIHSLNVSNAAVLALYIARQKLGL
ncbi:RNA methyltransferase [Breoghania sp. L-A4]|uniref:TrmH family RNA methyltransferase n=1 Tax=Breoghania sp. L-A4 TaxID=2304600 RepID=UPI000E35A001|nr:RNA methyltransferase [Breoghania sp. L-A4]AXS42639.1 RNA methyltransferase [Breoghania sp. L-A4]